MRRSENFTTATKRGKAWRGKCAGLFCSIVFLLIQSACGTTAGTSATGSTATAGQQAQSNEKPATETQTAAETQTAKDVFGEKQIPAHPQRVAVHGAEDIMLALDAPMVYAYSLNGYYLDKQLKERNIPTFDTWEPNMEAILAEHPDLIVISKNAVDEKVYQELNKIAPTLALNVQDWRPAITELGQILGLEDKAKAVIQAHDEKIKHAQAAIAKSVGTERTVAYIRPSDKDVQLFFPSFNLVYSDLNLKPDPSVVAYQKDTQDDWGINLSLEKLPSIKADYIFAIYGGSIAPEEDFQKDVASAKEIEKLQVWKSIPAVQQNHVFKVNSRHWMSSGPIAEGREIDDVVNAITGKQ